MQKCIALTNFVWDGYKYNQGGIYSFSNEDAATLVTFHYVKYCRGEETVGNKNKMIDLSSESTKV